MATHTRTTRLSFVVAVAITVATGAVYLWAPRLLTDGELTVYDLHFRLRGPRPGNEQVLIVAIDEESLRTVGRWPWPRSVLAELVQRLSAAGVAAVGVDIILNEPERSGELEAATRIAERIRAQGASAAIRAELERAIQDADHDRRLAEAIRASDRVILPSYFTLGRRPPTDAPARQGAPFKSGLGSFKGYAERGLYPPINADDVGLPIPPLREAAKSLGHVNMQADADGSTRWEALVIEYRGHYYPSLALETVRIAAGIDPFALRLDFGRAVELGEVTIPIDPRARVLIDYAGPGKTISHVAAADVLRGEVPAERLRDRIVFIGATAEGTYDLRVTPFSPVLPGVEKHANMAANILEGRFIIRPAWVELLEAGGILVFPFVLAVILPRLRPVASLGGALALWAGFFGANHLAFRQGLWLPTIYPSLAIALTFVAITIYRFLTEERQRLWTRRAFQQYVSPEVVARIEADPAALQFGGEVRPITVLFMDIRDFTGFTERHDPQEVVQMLREHLTRMTDCILREGGTLDKYIGDAIMAIFGAPVAFPDHAARACRAALAMVDELERLQAKWTAEGKEPFRIGIGINTADLVVGNLGSEQLFDYTAVGDGVNLGARLESLNKEYRTARAIIISESTYEAARDAVEARQLGEVTVKGKTRPVVTYELLDLKAPSPPG
ncbi:MAG: adenylate/guanylate cyclase domain-containing protein [Candidatus Rokubacteria bacterium]|nr:adenylate/guanylate cyclase domain-containing protein [Candidatus Rokubacteria bacterium]